MITTVEYSNEMKAKTCNVAILIAKTVYNWFKDSKNVQLIAKMLFFKYKCRAVVLCNTNKNLTDKDVFDGIKLYANELQSNNTAFIFRPWNDNMGGKLTAVARQTTNIIFSSLLTNVSRELIKCDLWKNNHFYFNSKTIQQIIPYIRQLSNKILKERDLYTKMTGNLQLWIALRGSIDKGVADMNVLSAWLPKV